MAKRFFPWVTLLYLLFELQLSCQKKGEGGLSEDILRRLQQLESTVTRIQEDNRNLKEEINKLRKIGARAERMNVALKALCFELGRDEETVTHKEEDNDTEIHKDEDKENTNDVSWFETQHEDTTSGLDEVSSSGNSSIVVEAKEKGRKSVLRVQYPFMFDDEPFWSNAAGWIPGNTPSARIKNRKKGNRLDTILETENKAHRFSYSLSVGADNFYVTIIFRENATQYSRQEIPLQPFTVLPNVDLIDFASGNSTDLSMIFKELPGYEIGRPHVQMITVNTSTASPSLARYHDYEKQEDDNLIHPIIWLEKRRENDEEIRSLRINPNGEDLEGFLMLSAIYHYKNSTGPVSTVYNSYVIYLKDVHHTGPFPEGFVAMLELGPKQTCYKKQACTIFCQSFGNRPVDVKLFKVTRNGQKEINVHSGIFKKEYRMTKIYQFSSVNEQDSGQYSCMGSSHTGQTAKVTIDLAVIGKVRIIQDMTGVENLTGKVTIRCTAQGTPEPTLTVEPWVIGYDGPPIQEGPYFHLERHDTKDYLSLVITVLKPIEKTHVRCFAKNGYEEAAETFYIP